MASNVVTDLSGLHPPDPGGLPSRAEVSSQGIVVPIRWWQKRLHSDQLPAFLVGDVPERRVTRKDVQELAQDLASAGSGLRLLWGSIAWGAGSRLRLCDKRVKFGHGGLALTHGSNPATDLDAVLRAAAASSRDPARRAEAYTLLHPARRQLVKYLGPAFGTKFLYFAGAEAARHPCQILDSRVATSLKRHGWASLRPGGGWPVNTYERYTDLLSRWTDELAIDSADQLEKWLFDKSG